MILTLLFAYNICISVSVLYPFCRVKTHREGESFVDADGVSIVEDRVPKQMKVAAGIVAKEIVEDGCIPD